MSEPYDFNAGGSTAPGTRAVVIRGGYTLRTERHTVVAESEDTVTLEDGTVFATADGLIQGQSELGPEAEDGLHPTRIVTEGHPEFEALWADAVLTAFTETDHYAYVEDAIAADRMEDRGDVHARYDVAAIIDELTVLHPDFDAIPEHAFWEVVDKHRRDEDTIR